MESDGKDDPPLVATRRGGSNLFADGDPDVIWPTKHKTGADVLPLANARPVPSRTIMSDLRVYWDSLRQGQAIPMRSDIQPSGIGSALDHAFILQRIGPGSARFRLAGRHLIDVMGMEVRGMPFSSIIAPASRGNLTDVLETVFSAPQIAHFDLQSGSDRGMTPLTAQLLLLPLRSDLGDVTRALGCLITKGPIGPPPHRFEIVSFKLEPVNQGLPIQSPSPSRADPTHDPDMPRSAALWRPAVRQGHGASASERRARFRVITGNTNQPDGKAPR